MTIRLIRGTARDDKLRGTKDADYIIAGHGSDYVFAGAGNDLVLGGAGIDHLLGEDGDDVLFGGDDDDVIDGGIGADIVSGGGGDDVIRDIGGDDFLDGGSGRDEIQFFYPSYDVNVDLRRDETAQETGFGRDILRGFEDVTVGGSNGPVNVRLDGDVGSNHLLASGSFNIELNGHNGDDYLSAAVKDGWPITTPSRDVRMSGGSGADTIEFSSHDSDILGGRYIDHLTADGGSGNDVFTVQSVGSAEIDAGTGNDLLFLDTKLLYLDSFGARYDIWLGKGVDTISLLPIPYYALYVADAILVRDFATGQRGDVIQLRDWSAQALIGWDGTNPFETGYLALAQAGGDTKLFVDRDGPTGDAFDLQALITLEATQLEAFTAANFDGWHPTGETPDRSPKIIEASTVGEFIAFAAAGCEFLPGNFTHFA